MELNIGKLDVQLRINKGKGVARKLRAQGLVPGICYGVGLDSPLQVSVDPKELKSSLDPEKGQNTVISLAVKDGDATKHSMTAMLWDYQIHPIKRNVLHFDLVAIDPDKVVDVDVPVEFVGRAKGLVEGGLVHIVRRVVPVRCKPADIPSRFTVDISPLDIGETLHVSDIAFPAGVESNVSGGLSLVGCQAPRAEVVETIEVEGLEGEAPAEGDAAKPDDAKKEGDAAS